jgi:hypothetical protein
MDSNDRGVTSSTSQVLVLPDVQVSLWVTRLLCETEIDDVHLITTFPDAHQKIVRFDITVNEIAEVDVLDMRDLIESKIKMNKKIR